MRFFIRLILVLKERVLKENKLLQITQAQYLRNIFVSFLAKQTQLGGMVISSADPLITFMTNLAFSELNS